VEQTHVLHQAIRFRAVLVGLCALLSVGWSKTTVRYVAWSAVDFFPPDLARQVRRNERRYEAGIERGLAAPPAWRAGEPGHLREAVESHVQFCADALLKPVPLGDLVEEMGVLAVRVLDANDPLAVAHDDPREPMYAEAYQSYVDSMIGRVRLVYYGEDADLVRNHRVMNVVGGIFDRSRQLYPFVGDEFFRSGELRNWHSFDDRSVAFGVAAISLSRGMSDLANLCGYVWDRGGGLVPTPRPTPTGHVGPTVTLILEGGFPERLRSRQGAPALPPNRIVVPPP
jgi:hypothetical protein